MPALTSLLRTLGPVRIAAIAGVAAVLLGLFGFVILRATTPQMIPLFTDLSVEDSSAVVKELERTGTPYNLKADGAVILVARDQVPRLRMKLAESGLPKGGSIGYEIFDKSDALGATSFVQNINHLRALEGELSRTIRAIDRVQQARVHLVLPERQLFSRERPEASASIVLKVRGALEAAQVRAIRHLVASAVTGLKPQRVSIVDETGRLLADGTGDEAGGSASADERKIAFEKRLRQQVESIVTSVVGPGRAQVQLTAEFDFNRITETSDRFDPDSRVVRSSQTREETSSNSDPNGAVTVANEMPGANLRGPETPQQTPREQNRKTEEIVNYEISRSTKTEVIEGGRVNRISVAVVVDGVHGRNDKGEAVYQPRAQEEMDRIAALVRSAIGFDAKRGDQVEVVNLRLAENTVLPLEEPSGWLGALNLTKDDIMHAVDIVVMALLGLLVLLLGVRPMLRRLLPQPVGGPAPRALAAPAGSSALTVPAGGALATTGDAVPASSRTAAMIDIAQVQGQVHALSVQKVGELADKNPNETVAIIRGWLHENAA